MIFINVGGAMYSQNVIDYRPRMAQELLQQMLQSAPVIMFTGPRSIGKSTLARKYANSELDLDNPQTVRYLEQSNYQELENLPRPVLIDEWQNSPNILSKIKRIVDHDQSKGQFLITGSASSVADQEIWPLVGRAAFLPIRPMTQSELRVTEGQILSAIRGVAEIENRTLEFTRDDFIDAVAESGYPSMIGVDFRLPIYSHLLRSIADNAIASEAKSLGINSNSDKLSDYLLAIAATSATLANESTVYQMAGVSRPSALKYDLALRKLGLTYQIPAFASSNFSRLKKRSKTIFADTAMLASINGWHKQMALRDPQILAVLAENFLAQQMMSFADQTFSKLSYLRTANGDREIDFILETQEGDLIPIEVKASQKVTAPDARHIKWFAEQSSQFKFGMVVYLGQEQFELQKDIYAVPISALWQ
jgi:predicted AAA+ superfamily ATPase